MAARLIQTFIRRCADCPHCRYYSGGMHECSLTDQRMTEGEKQEQVASWCPLPVAGKHMSVEEHVGTDNRKPSEAVMEAPALGEFLEKTESLRSALQEIADQDVVEVALDPDWPRRIAKAALNGGKFDA